MIVIIELSFLKKRLKTTHTQIIVIGFALLIFFGACVLNLPFSSKDGRPVGFINAFFTATSAVCVTGLVVVDTGTHWTAFGQVIIALLIQIGGHFRRVQQRIGVEYNFLLGHLASEKQKARRVPGLVKTGMGISSLAGRNRNGARRQ